MQTILMCQCLLIVIMPAICLPCCYANYLIAVLPYLGDYRQLIVLAFIVAGLLAE